MTLATVAAFAVWPTLVQPEFLHDHDMAVSAVAFSPSGNKVATATVRYSSDPIDYVIKVWDAKSHRLLATFSPYRAMVWDIAFSPDGESIIGLINGRRVAITRLTNRTTRYLPITANIQALAVCPNKTLATVGSDRALRFWDLATRECFAIAGPTPKYVSTMRVSPDGKTLAIVGGDPQRQGALQLWSINERKLVRTITTRRRLLTDADFSVSGTILAACDESRVMGWHTKSGKAAFSFQTSRGATALAFLPDGNQLVVGTSTEAAVYDAVSGKRRRQVSSAWAPSDWSISRARDGRRFAIGSGVSHNSFAGTAMLLDRRGVLATKRRSVTVAGWKSAETPFSPTCVDFANSCVVVGGGPVLFESRPAGMQLLEPGRAPTVIQGVRHTVTAVATLNGRAAAIASAGTYFGHDPEVIAFDTHSRRVLWRRRGHERPVISIASSPDARIASTADCDGTLHLWRTDDGKRLKTIAGIKGFIVDSAVANDRTLTLATVLGENSHTLAVHHGRELRAAPDLTVKHTHEVTAVCIDPKRHAIFFADSAGNVLVCSLKPRSIVATFSVSQHEVVAIAIHGTTVVTADATSRITVWSLYNDSALKKVKQYTMPESVTGIAISPDGQRAAAVTKKNADYGHVLFMEFSSP